MNRIEYTLESSKFSDMLIMLHEIYVITGMTPSIFEFEGEAYRWDISDIRRYRGGKITHTEYQAKHRIRKE